MIVIQKLTQVFRNEFEIISLNQFPHGLAILTNQEITNIGKTFDDYVVLTNEVSILLFEYTMYSMGINSK